MLSFSIAATSLPKLSLPLIPNKSGFAGLQTPQKCRFAPLRRTAAASVVMMAKKDDELKEIRTLTTDQINEQVVELKGELFMLRLQKSVRNEFKSSEFRRMRKKIARMLTVKREREIDEGINKRQSRKLDRQWKRSIVVGPPPSLRKLRAEEAAEEAAAAEKSA